MKTLLKMLTYKRPAYSATDEKFLNVFFRPLAGHANVTASYEDEAGNLFFEVRGGSETLFCAHSDTVHGKEGRQSISRTGSVIRCSVPGILGADDAAGLWIVRNLILAGVPSTVVVTRGEECGGTGAREIAGNVAFLGKYKRAIAFDRRGVDSVVTHQSGSRCCSDEFAVALSAMLNERGLYFAPDDSGIYTDTAEWIYDIPECTNLSVGYRNEHSEDETLDINFVRALCRAAMKIKWDKLPTERDPADVFDEDYDWLAATVPDLELTQPVKKLFVPTTPPIAEVPWPFPTRGAV